MNTREANCKNINEYVSDFAPRSTQDQRYFIHDHHPANTYKDFFVDATQLDQVKLDLHITKTEQFESHNYDVTYAVLDRLEDTSYLYSELLQRGMKILINVGEYDPKCGARNSFEWTKTIDLGDEREDFDSQARSIYKYLDPL